jgi:CRISPR-associated protein Cmr2
MNTATHEKQGDTTYTAVSFAPVQGFIEKSRKLRDLFGASLILSYLSQQLAKSAEDAGLQVISPALINVQEGMPNRILIRGLFERNEVEQTLIKAWDKILTTCRTWIETQAFPHETFSWEHEWLKWKQYTWEIFWGQGELPDKAMRDLERRKLKRDWTGVNWTGDSSSLTGTDAIAGPHLGKENKNPGQALTPEKKDELELFYRRLSWLLDHPERRVGQTLPSLEELRAYEKSNPDGIGKYIAPNERLSIPELVKRLVTYDQIANDIEMEKLKKKRDDPEFKDIYREAGYWTGWFLGDGDRIGQRLKEITASHGDDGLHNFSEAMRQWGQNFQRNRNQFSEDRGRVIYAGGDDFLGVIYSDRPDEVELKPPKIKPREALDWLMKLPNQWKALQTELEKEFKIKQTYSVGFVWAGHSVPQRDILQHCREAERRAKSLGRDRVTIRVVFNSGQYVQWTCPWNYLDILTKYCDREGRTWGDKKLNWAHVYGDWAQLKARHAIPNRRAKQNPTDESLAIALLNLYFSEMGDEIQKKGHWTHVAGDNDALAIAEWIDGLILVGWQLCSNT